MDVNCIRIFVFILIYKNISVTTGLKIRTARFRVHRKSHGLTRCAMKVLNQDSSVGGRVSDQSGACEILYALNQNQTKEPGYGYFEKVTVKTDFKPAVTIEGLGVPFNLPAPVRNGFRVEAKFTRKETYVAPYNILMEGGENNIIIEIDDKKRDSLITIYKNAEVQYTADFDLETMCPLPECKFTVIFKGRQIEILVNDQQMQNGTFDFEEAFLRQMKRVKLYSTINDVQTNGFEMIL